MQRTTLNRLIAALETLPTLRRRDGRDAWLERALPPRLVDSLESRRSPVARDDFTHILTALEDRRLVDGSLAVNLLIADLLADLPKLGLEESLGADLLELSDVVSREAGPPKTPPSKPTHVPDYEEVVIGNDERVRVDFFMDGLRAGKSVARLTVCHISGDAFHGTGWLIAPDLLITNYHVIKANPKQTTPIPEPQLRQQAASLRALLGFTGYDPAEEYRPVDLLAWDFDLDYALLRLEGAGRASTPLARWGHLRLVSAQPQLRRGARLNIIQHPDGRPQEYALRSNYFVSQAADDRRIYYLSDTEGGSSGSPVLNDFWQVVALHRAWDNFNQQYHGQPIQFSSLGLTYAGPTSPHQGAVAKINEGVPIHTILAHLPPALRAEIEAAQRRPA